MDLAELITLLKNRLAYLEVQRLEANSRGDINMIDTLDVDFLKTSATLETLQSIA
jgi:hypothetical protein